MHEGGLCEGVLGVVLDAAGGEPVRRVQLRIGQLQRVVADSFDFYWQMLAADTVAAQAVVDIAESPIRIRCRGCGGEHDVPDPIFLCPACASADVQLISGDGVMVEQIELESGRIIRNPNLAEVREDHEHAHS
jgi:hydrogenase nickel incorporation protein HypA/HybF